MKKRIVSLLMALALCLSLLPTSALAETVEELPPRETIQQQDEATEPAQQDEEPKDEAEGNSEEENEEESKEEAKTEESKPMPAMQTALSNGIALQANEHSHFLCGGDTCNKVGGHTENSATTFATKIWMLNGEILEKGSDNWESTGTTGSTDSVLELGEGTYYLDSDITVNHRIIVTGNVTLCLNGHNITANHDGDVIVVNSGVTFTLTDCKGGNSDAAFGKITHASGKNGRGVYVDSATFNMYGGSITGNKVNNSGGGVCVNNGGTFKMFGGSITGNKATDGGGVYIIGGNSKFIMTGGSITGNKATYGGGVYVNSGKFTVSGKVTITDNTVDGTENTANNVYLSYDSPNNAIITIADKLESSAKIGVTLANDHKDVFTSGWSSNMAGKTPSSYFTSDRAGYVPELSDDGKEVVLKDKTPATVTTAPTAKTGLVYNGNSQALVDAGSANGGTMAYSLTETGTYSNDIPTGKDATTYTVWYKVIGDNDHSDTEAKSVTVTIAPKALTADMVADIATQTYTGDPLTPAVTVKDGRTVLTAGADYTVSYKNNTKATSANSKATAKITGTGNYTGEITKEFAIDKATPTVTGTGTASGTYGQRLSEVIVDGLTVTLGEKTVEGRWALTDNTSDILNTVTLYGSTIEYTAIFTPTDTTNFTAAEAKAAVTIAPAAGGSLGTVNLTQKFTDTAKKTYTPNWAGLPAGERWSYISDHTTTGTARVSDSGLDVNNSALTYSISGGQAGDTVTFTLTATCASSRYDSFTITVVVKLTDKDTPTVKANNINVTYTGEDIPASAITGTATFGNASVAGTWSWKDAAPKNVADSGNYTVVFTPADSANYSPVETIITVAIAKATPAGAPKYTKITTSGKTLADAGLTLEGSTLNPNAGTLEWLDKDGNVLELTTVVEKNTVYTWRFTPTDTNYQALTGTVELYHVSSSSGGYYYKHPTASGTTDTKKSPGTGDAGLLVYGLTALTSYTGTALVLRRRKRED